ncbi:meiosis regulator and mRNA stability factor 1-like protein isoform X3 [Xylocopa sonorina]|uniref:meiosis regulator and mRNA stability factor 1-like protein isoform X3 n=1 Tax=Xylocopa sonorina TaxID=1818115 RepID=UPI00403A855E
MADQNTADYHALCANDKDEIEGLNERLIELLTAEKVSSCTNIESSTSQQLRDLNSSDDSLTVENTESVTPLLNHYKYHCSFSHHDSPVNFSSLPTYLPPIGVFWDIENCCVPKGRSAMAVTQVIRDKFFTGYREAEFIVVCDVLKENSRVMKELNNAQVNLIHVAREFKNAADDKLKQSIRRFADIHGSPAAVILISCDINFAADLSDLRYRKKIHVILLHMESTSEALILCANEHYDFSKLMESLPSRTVQVTAHYDLLVSNLPENQDVMSVKDNLKQLSKRYGGRLMQVQSNTAIVRFNTKHFADRAQKHMDGTIVLGSKISVKFQREKGSSFQKIRANSVSRNGTVSESEITTSSPRQMYSASASLPGGRPLQIPHYQSSIPVIGAHSGWNAHCVPVPGPPGMVQPPPVFVGRPYSNNNNVAFNRTYNELARVQSPLFWQVSGSQQFGHMWEEQYKVEKTKVLSRRIHIPQARDNGVVNNAASRIPDGLRRTRGTHIAYVQPSERAGSRQQHPPLNVSANLNGTTHSQTGFKRRSPSPMYDLPSQECNQWNGQPNMSVHNTRTPSPYENTVQTMNQQNNHTSPYHQSDTESEEVEEEQIELPYCTIHTLKPWSDKGWAEQKVASLPNVNISLKVLDPRIHQLLNTHNGSLPLPSLPNCYEAEFKEKLQVLENGVPLEHLVSCLSCVALRQGIGSVKYLIWTGNKTQENNLEEDKCVSPPLARQLALFSRELVDLLKTVPHCQLPFNRFIPAYHHHFGRQCRVADYGFTKLIDLLEALTHTVQVMGEGDNRIVTLSHRAQVRRFASDLLRVLKSKASKQVALSEFPSAYARVIGKPWDIVDYGVCEMEDILNEVSENIVVVATINGGDKMITIPKREQTAEEVEQTKQFAAEVVELLRHVPQCRMQFTKFVPSYHHHFGHQCRVSDYGFTKLIELFEAIPEVVKIEDDSSGERQISLTEKEGLRVLSEQISKLIGRSRNCLSVSSISQHFLRQFGYALKPELFGCTSVLQLMQKLRDTVQIVYLASGPVVMAIDKSHLQQLILQCRRLLMDKPQYKTQVKIFQQLYVQHYSKPCNVDELKQNLSNVVRFTTMNDEQYIELTPLHCFACNLYRVMINYGGTLKLSQFETAYFSTIGSVCKPADYGFPTIHALLQALSCTVTIKLSRKRNRNIIYLNKKVPAVGMALPSASSYRDTDSSNESFESDSPSCGNISTNSATLEERAKYAKQAVERLSSWKQIDKSWKTSSSEDQVVNWSLQENGSENFLKSLMRTPVIPQDFLPPPPKPDSPPEENVNKNQWESSVWTTPPKFTYPQDEHTPNVQIPPLTLPPSWNQIAFDNSVSNLLSPAKYLLPATANPLEPRTSPFFSSKRTLVVAPHPSELPLPSLSLTPKKNVTSKNVITENLAEKQKQVIDNSIEEITFKNNETDSSNMESSSDKEKHNIPTKQMFTSKRRLAAQFNQPIES